MLAAQQALSARDAAAAATEFMAQPGGGKVQQELSKVQAWAEEALRRLFLDFGKAQAYVLHAQQTFAAMRPEFERALERH